MTPCLVKIHRKGQMTLPTRLRSESKKLRRKKSNRVA